VFGHEAMSGTQTHGWYKRVKEGQTSSENNEHLGQPLKKREREKERKENIQKFVK
jgi:hypothetical protein